VRPVVFPAWSILNGESRGSHRLLDPTNGRCPQILGGPPPALVVGINAAVFGRIRRSVMIVLPVKTMHPSPPR